MSDEIKNGLIGVFVIAGLAILVFIILFLHPQTGDEGQTLTVRFQDLDKINVGTRVNFAGRPVGEVVEIREIPAPRDELFHNEGIYPFEVVLKIDSHIRVYNTDQFAIRTSGLLGERSIVITPKAPQEGIKIERLTGKEILFAEDVPTIEEAIEKFNELARKADDMMDAIMGQLDDLKSQHIWENLGKTSQHLASITGTLDVPSDWSQLLTSLKEFAVKANHSADRFFDFTTKLNTGQGTIARIVNEDDFYLRLTAVMSKADTLMDDINHYGVLFHNDKGWQRLRARRMNLMQKLECPQEFRNFFNDEVNMISTSLSRVATVLDETFCQFPAEELIGDIEFENLFADLLRRVSALEENIKMYNQQLITEYERSQGCCQ